MRWRRPSERDCAACFGSGRARSGPHQPCPHCRGAGRTASAWEDALHYATWAVLAVVLGGAALVLLAL